MKDLTKHIEELDLLLKMKGYDGFFLSAGGYPGKLTESLTAFTQSFFNGGEYGNSYPPALTTYCYWRDDKSDSIQCRFILDYQGTKGFMIKNVELESYDRYGFTAKKKMVPVNAVADIPARQQAKAWALTPEIKPMNRKRKGLKF